MFLEIGKHQYHTKITLFKHILAYLLTSHKMWRVEYVPFCTKKEMLPNYTFPYM